MEVPRRKSRTSEVHVSRPLADRKSSTSSPGVSDKLKKRLFSDEAPTAVVVDNDAKSDQRSHAGEEDAESSDFDMGHAETPAPRRSSGHLWRRASISTKENKRVSDWVMIAMENEALHEPVQEFIDNLSEEVKTILRIMGLPPVVRTVDELQTMADIFLTWSTISMIETIKLNSVSLLQVCQSLMPKIYGKREAIMMQGDVGDGAFILLAGSVSVFQSRKSKLQATKGAIVEEHICDLTAPCSFGELALESENSLRTATVRASKRCLCAVIEAGEYKRYVASGDRNLLLVFYRKLYGSTLPEKSILSLSFQSDLIRHSSRNEVICEGESAVDGDLYIIIQGSASVTHYSKRYQLQKCRSDNAILPFVKPLGTMHGVWSHKKLNEGTALAVLGVNEFFGEEALLSSPEPTYRYSIVCSPQTVLAKINALELKETLPRWERQLMLANYTAKIEFWEKRKELLGIPPRLSDVNAKLPLHNPSHEFCAVHDFHKSVRGNKRRLANEHVTINHILRDPLKRATLVSQAKKDQGVITQDSRQYRMNTSLSLQFNPADILYNESPPPELTQLSSLGFLHASVARRPPVLPLIHQTEKQHQVTKRRESIFADAEKENGSVPSKKFFAKVWSDLDLQHTDSDEQKNSHDGK